MRTRCKVGDLAVIIEEEPGLETNIGRVAWVHEGPYLDGEYGPVFVIKPASNGPLGCLCRDGSVSFSAERSYHPDAWMFPVWRPSRKAARRLRAPLRNLPKLSREWLEAVKRGEA